MVLDNVSDGARLIIEGASALDTKILRHGDLYAFDIIAIPERFEKGIGESEVRHVLNRPLSQVMVDAEDRRLGKTAQQDAVELQSRGQVGPERLFDDDAGASSTTGLCELFHDRAE